MWSFDEGFGDRLVGLGFRLLGYALDTAPHSATVE